MIRTFQSSASFANLSSDTKQSKGSDDFFRVGKVTGIKKDIGWAFIEEENTQDTFILTKSMLGEELFSKIKKGQCINFKDNLKGCIASFSLA